MSIFIWTTASAYDWNSDYGVDATIGGDDNFRLTEIDPVETAFASLGVFADLDGTTEISSLRFKMGAKATNYTASSIEDIDEYLLSLATARNGERWSGALDISLASRSTTETELLDTGNVVDGMRNSAIVAPGVSYQLNERNSIYSNLSFSVVTYDTVSLTDYTENVLGVGWVYSLSETSEISINGNVSQFDPSDSEPTDIIGLNLGYGFSTSEATRYDFALGSQTPDDLSGLEQDPNSSVSVSHSLDERNSFSLSLGNGYEGSGQGQVQYVNRLDLRWDHALAERMQFQLSANGYDSRERDYFQIVAGGSYQFTREISLAGNLRYRNQQTQTDDADSSSVSISLSWSSF